MISRLSQLADLIQEGSLPAWLKNQIEEQKKDILEKLEREGSATFTFKGPNGEEIHLEISPERDSVAA